MAKVATAVKVAPQFFTKLSCGTKMPLLGFGTFQMKEPVQLRSSLISAIQTGYRHIDTAFAHKNEHLIGETLEKDVFDKDLVKREDLFITTKLHSSSHERNLVRQTLKVQLKALRLQYVDLYLIHFPVPFSYCDKTGRVVADKKVKLEETWAGMEDCVRSGLVRSIGLSNCNGTQIARILENCSIKPSVNQIEVHPALQNVGLVELCKDSKMTVMAYAPFGGNGHGSPISGNKESENLLENQILKEIGEKYGKRPAQVILRWLIQRDISVVVKSVKNDRIVANFQIWDFKLDDADMAKISKLDAHRRVVIPSEPALRNHPDYPFHHR